MRPFDIERFLDLPVAIDVPRTGRIGFGQGA
jgi:hypothetical protein